MSKSNGLASFVHEAELYLVAHVSSNNVST